MARLELWRRTRISSRRVIIGWPTSGWSSAWSTCPGRSSPPYVQDITETPYRTSQFAEIQNPAGLPA